MQPPPTPFFVRRFRSIALVPISLAAIVACRAPGPVPTPPGAPPSPEVTPPRTTGSWTLRRAPESTRYEIRSSALIELAGDSIPGDSLNTAMVVSLFLADSAGMLNVMGTIDSLRITRGTRITTTDSTPALPIPLHGAIDRHGGVVHLGHAATTSDSLCTATLDPLVSAARDLFVRLPERLTSGATWQDTTRTTSCRGRIPVTTTAIATYNVLGEQLTGGGAAVAISRSTALTLEGTGEQYGRSATVQGTGTGSGTLLVDPRTGALTEGRTESAVTVTFEAGMLRQTFTQRGVQNIRRR